MDNFKNKKIVILIVVLILIVLLSFLYTKRNNISFLNKKVDLILKANVNLKESDIIFIEKRLSENKAKLLALGIDASLIEKVNLNFVISVDYRLLGEYGEAKKVLEETMLLDPLNSNIISVYSSLLAVMGDKDGALSYINKAIDLYPKETNYWLWKFDLEKEKNISSYKLEKIYKEALLKTDNDLNIIVLYARFLENNKRYDEAILNWKKAIDIYPVNKELYELEINRLLTL